MATSDGLEGRLGEIERRLSALEQRIDAGPLARETQKPVSVAEFLRSKRAKSGPDKAVVIAYHLEKLAGSGPFTLADIRHGFVLAKEPLPANSRDLVHRAIQRGLMMETGEEKKGGFRTLVLTNSGEAYVESGLHGGLKD